MVLLNVKKSEREQFLISMPAATSVEDAIQLCVEIRTMYERLDSMCSSLETKLAGKKCENRAANLPLPLLVNGL